MAAPPIVAATIQTAIINALSAVLAQLITAQQNNKPFHPSPLPIFQFLLFGLVSTPPNFLWQDFLESTFPAYHAAPTREAVASAAAARDDSKELDGEARAGRSVEPRLNKRNTLAKAVLDQTVGAVVNTLLYSCFMHGIQMAMAHHHQPGGGEGVTGWGWLLSDPWGAVRYGDVDWAVVWEKARAEFWGLLTAGWRFWPLVSVVNYVFLTSVQARNLVGSLAGLGWGVYLSLAAGK
ncbi:Protein sym1 [Madurella mycetomatis]|uniref:Protein sym1 n=1 Tax=Madurella mycetomatis TaxID=100816 RepID=A0A175VYU2_9PEZI|nr:Protein sym1 [Madurella mycetomatis]